MLTYSKYLTARHVLIALAIATLAGVVGWASFAKQTNAAAESESVAEISAVSAASASSFKLLRGPSEQAMPASAAAAVAGPHRYGRNAGLARSIVTETGVGWVIPGRGVLCVAMPDPVDGYATSCVPEEFATRNGLYVGLVDGETLETKVTLVVPDGTTRVRVGEGGKRMADFPIDSDGVVRGTVAGGSTLEVTSGGITRNHTVGVADAPGVAR